MVYVMVIGLLVFWRMLIVITHALQSIDSNLYGLDRALQRIGDELHLQRRVVK